MRTLLPQHTHTFLFSSSFHFAHTCCFLFLVRMILFPHTQASVIFKGGGSSNKLNLLASQTKGWQIDTSCGRHLFSVTVSISGWRKRREERIFFFFFYNQTIKCSSVGNKGIKFLYIKIGRLAAKNGSSSGGRCEQRQT